MRVSSLFVGIHGVRMLFIRFNIVTIDEFAKIAKLFIREAFCTCSYMSYVAICMVVFKMEPNIM